MPRILIVDDDRGVRASLALFFGGAGWDVLQAGDGNAALRVIETADIDVLITDIRMPGMDGWTLAEAVRAQAPAMPVIYVTGWSGVAERPVTGGIIVDKPYDAAALLALADRLWLKAPAVRPATAIPSGTAASRRG